MLQWLSQSAFFTSVYSGIQPKKPLCCPGRDQYPWHRVGTSAVDLTRARMGTRYKTVKLKSTYLKGVKNLWKLNQPVQQSPEQSFRNHHKCLSRRSHDSSLEIKPLSWQTIQREKNKRMLPQNKFWVRRATSASEDRQQESRLRFRLRSTLEAILCR